MSSTNLHYSLDVVTKNGNLSNVDMLECQSEASNYKMDSSDWLTILSQSESSKFKMEASDWLKIESQSGASILNLGATDWLKMSNTLWMELCLP